MDFGSWTKNLPFKGLDELAAQDDYVNSEGLHVIRDGDYNKDSNSGSSCTSDDPESQQQQQQHYTEMISVTINKNNNINNNKTEMTLATATTYDMVEKPPQQPQATKQAQPLYPVLRHHHSLNDNDDQAEDDFFLRTKNENQNSKSNKNNSDRSSNNSTFGVLEMELMHHDEDESESELSELVPLTQPKPKHRFLEELDTRLAKKNTPSRASSVRVTLSSSSNDTSNNKNNQNSSSSQQQSTSWLFGLGGAAANNTANDPHTAVETLNNKQKTVEELPPLSRQRIKTGRGAQLTTPEPGKEMRMLMNNNFDKVTSSAMLDADDLLTLEQMKQLNETQSFTDRLKETIQGHPREAFVVLTLLLAILVYFYQWQVSSEDDVH